MKLEVNEKVLGKTIKCDKDFRCLERDAEVLGDVIQTVGTKILVTLCGTKSPCPYFNPLSEIEGLCTCPTRMGIYVKYGL